MTNPFEELADRLDRRLDRIEALLLEKSNSQLSESILPKKDDLLNIKQAAQLLNMAKGSIYQLVHKGTVPYMKRSKKLYFSEKELRQWLQSGRRQTVQEIQKEAVNALSVEKTRTV